MALFKCLRAQFAEPSPEKKLVNDAVAALQIVMGHRFLHAYAFLSLSSLLSIQYNILLGRARWMFAATTWTNVVVFGCLTLYVIFPKSLRKSTINIFYVCGMALAAAYLSPWHTPADQLLDFALIMFVFFRLPAVILCTKTSLVFLCNMTFVVITAYRATHEEMATEGAFGSSYFVLWMELSTCVIALACHIGFQSTLQRKAELKLRGADAEKQFDAASTLLGLCCDAVVELDSDFCLLSHSKALAALLLRSNNLAGSCFFDLLCGTDRERAMEHLRNFGGQGVMAHAFHTHILDSCATKLSAEVFQVKYNKTDGQVCHLVGLREFSDAHLPDTRKRGDSDQSDYVMIDALESLRSEVDLEKGADGNDETDEHAEIETMSTGDNFANIPTKTKAFLVIDLDDMKVSAASAPVDQCVGMPLMQLFSQHMIQLLKQLHSEAKKLEESGHALRSTNFSFAGMPVYWTPTNIDRISGSIHMLQTKTGPRVMISFTPRVLPQSRLSKGSVGSGGSVCDPPDIETPASEATVPSTAPKVREHL